jgi:isopenicillin N synthase-like dioxygenase
MSELTSNIPVVDLRDLATSRASFVQALGDGLAGLGFVAVVGHPIDGYFLDQCYAAAARVFALPESVKRRYEIAEGGRQRGFTPFGTERAKDQNISDLKEFWQLGRDPLPGSTLPVNIFPAEVPEFGDVFTEYYARCETVAVGLLGAIGEYLGRPPGFFERLVENGNTVARVLHYPDLPGGTEAGAVRAAAHEDINLITLLPASTKPGLELLARDGTWMATTVPPGVLIVDTGDIMQFLTAGRLPSTTHRVVNPDASDGGRFSLPFFVHPYPEALLVPENPSYGEPIRADDMLKARLREIGVA